MLLAAISIISFNLSSAYADPLSPEIPFSVSIDAGIEVSVPSTLELPITPSTNGTYASKPLNIAVSTNNITGYTLTMHNDSSNLVHNSDSTITIPTLDNEVDKSSFPLNKWGYSLDDNTYKPIIATGGGSSTSDTTLKTTNTYGNADTTTINLATKVDLAKPAGTYTNTFIFTATANQSIFTITWNANGGIVSPTTSTMSYGAKLGTLPTPTYEGYDFTGWFTQTEGGEEVTPETRVTGDATYYAQWEEKVITLADITFMQEVTSKICANTATATATSGQYQLKDSRDNKLYWVAKLADGNCWMTQNLDFNISTTNVKSADSDVSADWTTSSTYGPVATITSVSSYTSSTNTVVQSWDPGNYYYDGTSSTSCGSKKTTYSGCTGFSNTGDAHRHVGNLYSWNAATAGTGGTMTSGQAAGSICPKGWRLPMSSGDPSFANLQTKGSLGSTVQNWLNAPYYFTRTGKLWYDSDKLNDAGRGGHYWSSTPISDSLYAYYLYFYDSSIVNPANDYGRRALGMSVRCVARP